MLSDRILTRSALAALVLAQSSVNISLGGKITDSTRAEARRRVDSLRIRREERLDSIMALHGQPASVEGELVLFPKSPQVKFNVFAVLQPLPGNLRRQFTLANFESTDAFQARFFVGENSTGYPVDESMPDPFGPRNCAHCASTRPTLTINSSNDNDNTKRSERFVDMDSPDISSRFAGLFGSLQELASEPCEGTGAPGR